MSSIFGPVHSRRFGISLGIDLSSAVKQCNFDCLYCELSPAIAINHQHTVTSVEAIVAELTDALKHHPDIDVITLTANGEPTMYPYLDELITRIKAVKGEKEILILSNSACLNDVKVFNALLCLDQVKLSLDAATPEVFKKIDRPAEGIRIEQIIADIGRFSTLFRGKLYLEILFVRGINDTAEEVAALNQALLTFNCDRIDIGTVDRPPAYNVQGLEFSELYALSQRFDAALPIHIVSRTHASATPSRFSADEILTTLNKRPLTDDDIAALLDDESKITFRELAEQGKILQTERSRIHFWIPAENLHRKSPKRGLFS